MAQTISPPRSFLFTDVEGSTKLWEDDPDGMAASLDGRRIVVDGQFVLGNLVKGEIQDLRLGES